MNWSNRTLYCGDNIDFLRAMSSESVHLIATDPPFNKGKDFHATPDSLSAGASFRDRWSWSMESPALEHIAAAYLHTHAAIEAVVAASRQSYGDDMGAYLCFLAVRLLEMHRILRHDGSLYLHCDPTASHYIKQLLDVIFARGNFRNEIVWHYTGGGRSKRYFSRKHDVLFFYSKSKDYCFNLDAIRVPYKPTSGYAKSGVTAKSGKYYAPHPQGTLPDDVWDIPIINPMSKTERVGYPTQKPLALYARIIEASSNIGDVVLDPFAGCATTLIAAEQRNRQWVGIDIWEGTRDILLERIAQIQAAKSTRTQTTALDLPDLSASNVTFSNRPPTRTDGN